MTKATLPTGFDSVGSMNIRKVVFDSTRGVFIAAGENGLVLKSVDGIKWILDRYQSGANGQFLDMVADENQVYAVNYGGLGSGWGGTGSYIIGTN